MKHNLFYRVQKKSIDAVKYFNSYVMSFDDKHAVEPSQNIFNPSAFLSHVWNIWPY